MHAYVLTRGIKHRVDLFITMLQGQALNYEYKKGKVAPYQFGVRPVQLWEFGFPEPKLDIVLTTLLGTGENIVKKPGRNQLKLKALNFALGKSLGLEKIPKTWDTSKRLPVVRQDMETIGIGLKKDVYVDGIEQI